MDNSSLENIIDGSIVLAAQDQREITGRLMDIINSLRAMRHMVIEGLDTDISEHLSTALAEMSRANIKGIDAVVERLGSTPAGSFATEFSQE